MTRRMIRFRALGLLALPLALLAGACSDDDKPTQPAIGACCLPDGSCEVTTPADCDAADGLWQGAGTVCDPDPCRDLLTIPELPRVDVIQDVDFGSVDPNAIEAQQAVRGHLQAPDMTAAFVNLLVDYFNGAEWSFRGSGCYRWTETEDECTSTFDVCGGADGMEWTVTLDGDCNPEYPPFSSWVGTRGWSNDAGTSGWFHVHFPGTELVVLSWTWEADADGRSGTWVFYQGARVPESMMAAISLETREDSSQSIDWILYSTMTRWTMEVSADGTEGRMDYNDWVADDAEWRLSWVIVWHGDGTGSNTTYDEGGNPVSVTTW